MPAKSRPAPLQPGLDGRHARSQATRARIVAALLELVRGGEVAPSAARVAETAGVGLRTVFRHFDEMDTLYREMTEAIEAQVMPMVLKPFAAPDWPGRVREMAARRIEIYELMMPYRISASAKRYQSEFLMQSHQRTVQLERGALLAILPDAIAEDAAFAGALDLTLSFAAWRRLRHDQQLSREAARAIIAATLEALLARAPG